MPEELSYALITPYSILKSRTGGIISRLISRTGLDLVAGTLFAPSAQLVSQFADQIPTADPHPGHQATQRLIQDYIRTRMAPAPDGTPQRALCLVFKGTDAVAKIRKEVGHIAHPRTRGESIRDTFGDYVTAEDGSVRYFEPAVLAPPDSASAIRDLRLWADHAETESGVLDTAVRFEPGEGPIETTLVLIKPDNFRFPNARPGGVIDVFSRTGLYIIGFKVHRMSVAQAEAFYGPVLGALDKVFRAPAGFRAKSAIEKELGIVLPSETAGALGDLIGPVHARSHWENILQFMTGTRPSDCPDELKSAPGSEKCIALVYQGPDAVAKIRAVLGPTDPSKAPAGSIRKEFGLSMMVNAAHASDSAANAEREMGIIGMGENNFKAVVENYPACL